MTDTHTIYMTKDGRLTHRKTDTFALVDILGNESFKRRNPDAEAACWGVELTGKLKHVTKSRDAARAFRRERCPQARVVALG